MFWILFYLIFIVCCVLFVVFVYFCVSSMLICGIVLCDSF